MHTWAVCSDKTCHVRTLRRGLAARFRRSWSSEETGGIRRGDHTLQALPSSNLFPFSLSGSGAVAKRSERLSYLCHRLRVPQETSQPRPRHPELCLAHKRTQKGSPPFLDLIFTETGGSFPVYLKTFDSIRAPHLTDGRTSLGLNQALSMMKICTVSSVI